ncbi:hypothetical protein R3P38DRAFT_2793795 [Favolaschia claudopus]|uniref:Uncharacterized protein n=1 Tax=Favolaschia claudopus TaxID=2862362 RepID=A0AAW0ACT8_9AGAR
MPQSYLKRLTSSNAQPECEPNLTLGVPLHRCVAPSDSKKNKTLLRRQSTKSTAVEDNPSATASGSKAKDHSAKCQHAIRNQESHRRVSHPQTVVSAMLLMPMPYLDTQSNEESDHDADEAPNTLKRIISRRPPPRRRNSLILPEVPMPQNVEEPAPWQPYERNIRDNPPTMQERVVRFAVPRGHAESGMDGSRAIGGDGEPAWSDFMNLKMYR